MLTYIYIYKDYYYTKSPLTRKYVISEKRKKKNEDKNTEADAHLKLHLHGHR